MEIRVDIMVEMDVVEIIMREEEGIKAETLTRIMPKGIMGRARVMGPLELQQPPAK